MSNLFTKIARPLKLIVDILLKSHSPCLQLFWCYSLNLNAVPAELKLVETDCTMSQINNWPHGGAIALQAGMCGCSCCQNLFWSIQNLIYILNQQCVHVGGPYENDLGQNDMHILTETSLVSEIIGYNLEFVLNTVLGQCNCYNSPFSSRQSEMQVWIVHLTLGSNRYELHSWAGMFNPLRSSPSGISEKSQEIS